MAGSSPAAINALLMMPFGLSKIIQARVLTTTLVSSGEIKIKLITARVLAETWRRYNATGKASANEMIVVMALILIVRKIIARLYGSENISS